MPKRALAHLGSLFLRSSAWAAPFICDTLQPPLLCFSEGWVCSRSSSSREFPWTPPPLPSSFWMILHSRQLLFSSLGRGPSPPRSPAKVDPGRPRDPRF